MTPFTPIMYTKQGAKNKPDFCTGISVSDLVDLFSLANLFIYRYHNRF